MCMSCCKTSFNKCMLLVLDPKGELNPTGVICSRLCIHICLFGRVIYTHTNTTHTHTHTHTPHTHTHNTPHTHTHTHSVIYTGHVSGSTSFVVVGTIFLSADCCGCYQNQGREGWLFLRNNKGCWTRNMSYLYHVCHVIHVFYVNVVSLILEMELQK